MATLALAAAGAAIGSTLLPAGVTVLGATITGATIGSQIGALAGSYIDNALMAGAGGGRAVQGPRLTDLRVTSSTEGAPIPRVYGRCRLGGQVIWALDFEEEVVTQSAGGGGKGGRSGGSAAQSTEYRYYGSFAVALCEGEVSGVGRIWADGRELDLAEVTWRLHSGGEDQLPDPLIEAREGAGFAPAYRGTAYVVFERLALREFGNRLPQLSFEVYRAFDPLADLVTGVVLIPGTGEFAYATEPVRRVAGAGVAQSENVHTLQASTDLAASLDQLATLLPAVGSVSLVVSWFGTDLRVAQCQLRPGVESRDKVTEPLVWSCAGETRASAHLVSEVDGRPAFGGTPSDETVISAIAELRARGHLVTLNPFVLMDIPAANTLPDPYTGTPAQPAYPWRGRLTLDVAPGRPGSPDTTVAAAAQIASFVGTATPADFSISGANVVYSGPAEWSYRRMILHLAHLAKAAGGVDAFLVGSELRGLTTLRDGLSSYPFVAALAQLAADVKAVLGPATKVTYAADWSEYFGHHPQDGSGDVHFHLDPLWSSPAIDAIGLDVYWPLSDWREGSLHRDALDGVRSIYDLDHLKSRLRGGEGFDWYYASEGDRDAQLRTAITDGAGKPWVFRYKDLVSWWSNAHYDRPGGIEAATPTAWVPQSKPFWLLEVGCGAVDKGANEPNVFPDPKSAENRLPRYSNGRRDDLMQRAYLRAVLEGLDPSHPGHLPGANPISALTGARMIDTSRTHVYAWDARPHPAFPADTDLWQDGWNWRLGHWLNGRAASVPLAECVAHLLSESGFQDFDVTGLEGLVPGYVVERVLSAREALQPLELAYFFDAVESGGRIAFRHRGAGESRALLTPDVLVETQAEAALLTLTRAQETELPASAKVAYLLADGDHERAVAEARRLAGASGRVALAELPLALESDRAASIAETWLFEAWSARERAAFTLPPSQLALEPGDVVTLDLAGSTHLVRLTSVADHGAREVEGRSLSPHVYEGSVAAPRPLAVASPASVGRPLIELLDLPLLEGDEPAQAGYAVAYQSPWRGGVAIYASPETTGFFLKAVCPVPGVLGTLLDPLVGGPEGRWDRATRLRVRLDGGALASATPLQVLGGRNAALVRQPGGAIEVLQFERADLVGAATYELSGLLRGQAGTEAALAETAPAGSRFVLLDAALTRIDLSRDECGLALNWRYGPASEDIGHSTYQTISLAFFGRGWRPYSPVHVRGARLGGDLTISWVRRTRIGGDGWEQAEVPLSEEAERYEVEILDGDVVRRTLSSTAPSAVYPAADQIADFGSLQGTCTVRVYQVSPSFGRGAPRSAIV